MNNLIATGGPLKPVPSGWSSDQRSVPVRQDAIRGDGLLCRPSVRRVSQNRRVIRATAADGAPIVALVDADTSGLVSEALRRYDASRAEAFLAVLVPYKTPPLLDAREDGTVLTLCAVGEEVESIVGASSDPATWCYLLLDTATRRGPDRWIIEVVDRATAPLLPCAHRKPSLDVVVPHRGPDDLLAGCLSSIQRQDGPVRIALAYDQVVGRRVEHLESAFRFEPHPVGPYIFRQHVGLTTDQRFLAFQDSDDIALPDRFSAMLAHLQATGSDIVGCHELRLDDLSGEVRTRRFPLDASAAFAAGPFHAQFFPTTVVAVDAFRAVGGLSSHLRFGCDLQFLLRASLALRMSNVDRFLYVRRRRRGSLTTASATGLESAVRLDHRRRWIDDFASVRNGEMAIETSSLVVQTPAERPALIDLPTGRSVPLRLRTGEGAA